MAVPSAQRPQKLRIFTRKQIDQIPRLRDLPQSVRDQMKAVSAVLPFRVNEYVIEELIDWSDIPNDPIFQLTFPQPGMLSEEHFSRMLRLVRDEAPPAQLRAEARVIQQSLNPHPAGQMNLNVPRLGGEPLPGMQHKYRETVLFFPAAGQTCHTYCTYCFRWAQFVGIEGLKFASLQTDRLVAYLERHPEVSSVLITGGDPMVMKTSVLRRYVEPLLRPSLSHVASIRIGTKAPAYWPQRFVSDADADGVLRLFQRVVGSGKHLALMAHYSHPRELATPMAEAALRRIRSTGAVVRTQAPLIRKVNDTADCWAEMWKKQVRLGAVPYYMFVERDTGAKQYFKVPLARASEIFTRAYRRISGLGRTVRGPSMSALPGKVLVDGVTTVRGEKVFVLQFLQARNPKWVGRPFFAKFDAEASWLNELEPALGKTEFFYQPGMRALERESLEPIEA